MKHLFTVIVGALFLATAAIAAESEVPLPFNPTVHSKTNLPAGIDFVESGKIDLVNGERIVVNDVAFPFTKKTEVYGMSGAKIISKKLTRGQSVDVYADGNLKARYVVVK